MVRGLEIFRSHFRGFADRYVLIGGTACDLVMTSVGLSFRFILAGRSTVEGLTVVGASHLIALKARAWLDLTRRRAGGETIDDRDIRKHRNDVFRLYRILDPDVDPSAPEAVRKDLSEFVSRMGTEDVDLKSLGLRKTTLAEVLVGLRSVYRLE